MDAVWNLKCLNYKLFNISEPHILFTKYDNIDFLGLSRKLKKMMYVQTVYRGWDPPQANRLPRLPRLLV